MTRAVLLLAAVAVLAGCGSSKPVTLHVFFRPTATRLEEAHVKTRLNLDPAVLSVRFFGKDRIDVRANGGSVDHLVKTYEQYAGVDTVSAQIKTKP